MKQISSWISNHQTLLSKYKNQYVAITDEIIAFGDHLEEINQKAQAQGEEYVLYYVPNYIQRVKILPIHVKSFSTHEWQPLYPIELFKENDEKFIEQALIDSGVDISCFPYQLGADLGFENYPQELPLKAVGIGGETDYIQRQIKIGINGNTLKIPVAWIQDKKEAELIIGRAVVFDYFDITFRQSQEQIIFQWLG